MDQVLEFVMNHPFLVGIFAVLLALFVRNETRRGGESVSAQQLVEMVNKQNAIVLDVRDKKEFDQGHIVDSVNIPFSALESRVDEISKHKDRPIVIACKMGQHANAAGTVLRKKGFETVTRLTGGIMEWRNQNLPVVK